MKTKRVAAGACAMMLMGPLAGQGMAVMAATEGATPVTYDNGTIIDVDGNGEWGVAIPTSINFTDAKKVVTSEVELIGINGTNLDTVFRKIDITGKVKSAGGYKMAGPTGSTPAEYEMTIDGKKFEKNNTEQTFKNKFGMDKTTGAAAVNKKLNLSATLTKEGKQRGQYKDTLVFNFAGTATKP